MSLNLLSRTIRYEVDANGKRRKVYDSGWKKNPNLAADIDALKSSITGEDEE